MPFNAGASGRVKQERLSAGGSVSVVVILVVVVVVIVGVATGLDDVEGEAALEFHAGGTEDGAQGARGATLLADDFADVAGGDVETEDGGLLIGKDFDSNRICVVDQGPSDFRH